jgi:hypothetical protein
MAENDRERHPTGLAGSDVHVASAHAANENAYERAARLGIYDGHFPRFDAVGFNQHCGSTCSHVSPFRLQPFYRMRHLPHFSVNLRVD